MVIANKEKQSHTLFLNQTSIYVMKKIKKYFLAPEFDEPSRKYINSPTSRGFPMGGIGTGGISLYADGDFSEARTNHCWFKAVRDLRGSFFAIRTKDSNNDIKAKLLRRTHHHSSEYQVDNIAKTIFKGEIPQFRLQYKDEALPVHCTLTGFTPLIPHNVKDSSLPVALFDMEVENPSREDVEVSLLFSWQNVLGITGTGGSILTYFHTFYHNVSRFNYCTLPEKKLPGVKFTNSVDYPANDTRRRSVGSHMITTSFSDGTLSTCLNWDQTKARPEFWDDFMQEGSIQDKVHYPEDCPSRKIKGKSGALCVKINLKPNDKQTVPFYLIWCNPYYVLEKYAKIKLLFNKHNGTDYGAYYTNFFHSPEEISEYLFEHKDRLYRETMELLNIVKDPSISNLPGDLTDIILNAADSILTNSVLTKDGRLFTIEGMDWQFHPPFNQATWPFGGLTGTNDQRLSSHIYTSLFFTQLDKSELTTFRDLSENGKVPHGNGGAEIALGDINTPYSQPIPWINDFQHDWPDLTCSLIMQLGKYVKMTGDRELLYESWPYLMQMSDYLLSLIVDGVPEGSSTYDVFVYKPCFLYHATLYAAANLMLADLTRYIPMELDPECLTRENIFKDRANAVMETFNFKLWVEEQGYYKVCETKNTVFQGGLAGDWINRMSGLPSVVDRDRALSHNRWQHKVLVESSLKKGYLANELGGRPLPYNEANLQGEEVPLLFMGIKKKRGYNYIYQTISYMNLEGIYLGNVDQALQCIRMIYDKVYKEGYPWDMNLLGGPGYVYMTHPVMWGLFNAFTGAALDLFSGTLYLSPKPLPGKQELRLPIFFPHFWASFDYHTQKKTGRVKILKVHSISSEEKNNKLILKKIILSEDPHQERTIELKDLILEQGAEFPL